MICNNSEVANVVNNGAAVNQWVHDGETVHQEMVTFTVINDNATNTYEFGYGDTVDLNTQLPYKIFSGFVFDGFTTGDSADSEIVTSVEAIEDKTFRCVYHRVNASGSRYHYPNNQNLPSWVSIPSFDAEEFANIATYVGVVSSNTNGPSIRITEPTGFGGYQQYAGTERHVGNGIGTVEYEAYTGENQTMTVTIRMANFSSAKKLK